MSAVDNYREQERCQAAELRVLAGAVAGLLGYTVDPPVEDAYYRDAVRLCGPDGAALSITRPWNDPLRVSVHAGYPQGTSQVAYHLPSHTITVAVSRGAQAIAREIQRRLLPGYLSDLTKALDALRARADATQARQKVAAGLLAAVPGLRRGIESDTRVTLTYYRGSAGRTAAWRSPDRATRSRSTSPARPRCCCPCSPRRSPTTTRLQNRTRDAAPTSSLPRSSQSL